MDSKIPNKSIKIINALVNPNRKNYDIKNNEKLIIVGNPPYNDKTSKSKKHLKEINYEVDDELKHRDIGISFLKSYVKLNPDYICILHPLSYLIKQQNFKSLKEFKDNYILKDGIIISSKYFTKGSEFPIIIGFYEKGQMDFEY
ncbi:adenine methyltransferase, partial [Campylobacter jejuni]|nr:adenine methyltransferase [Campylobacter jejuni]